MSVWICIGEMEHQVLHIQLVEEGFFNVRLQVTRYD